jgi:probable HAF family extracellular repeat protein
MRKPVCFAILFTLGVFLALQLPAAATQYTCLDLGTGYAYGINSAGQVVGGFYTGSGYALLYSGGTMQDLGTLGGSPSGAYGINATGQVVGYSSIASGDQHAFLYSGSAMQDLGTLGRSYSYASGMFHN